MALPSRPYPVNLLLAGRSVLVVGGGAVALEKVDGLLDAEAEVRTEMTSSASMKTPNPLSPNTTGPSARKTSSLFASLPRPVGSGAE